MNGPGAGASDYNRMFERFVEGAKNPEDELRGMIAYALYKRAKREWTEDFRSRNSCKPADTETAEYVRTWTDSRVAGLISQADTVLRDFASEVVNANRHEIEKDALKGKFWKDVGIGVMASLLFTLLVVALAIVAKTSGIDLLDAYNSLG